MDIEFKQFVRLPFAINAVQITDENIHQLCELVGHEVKTKNDNQFIVINRKIVPTGYRAYVGWWVTKMGENLRVYPNKIFENQFTEQTEETDAWFGISEDDEFEGEPDREDYVMEDVVSNQIAEEIAT